MKSLLIAALAACTSFAAATHAASIDVTVSGTYDIAQINSSLNIYSATEQAYINSVGLTTPKNTFSITFRYDSTATPTSQSGNAANGTATYTNGISLVSATVGTFSNFAGFVPTLTLSTSTSTSPSLGGDRFIFTLIDPTSSRRADLDVHFGILTSGGRDVFASPFALPDTPVFNGNAKLIYAGVEVRKSTSYYGFQKSINYTTGQPITAGIAPPAVPTPAAATAGLTLLGLTLLARRRHALA